MKKIIPVACISIIFSSCSILKSERVPASIKQASCFARVSDFEKVYSTKTEEELKTILSNAESFGIKNAVVDQKGTLHQRYSTVEIEEKRELKVYGRVFYENEIPYFHYLKNDNDQILNKISLADLYQKGIAAFKKDLAVGDYIMLPLVSKGEFIGHYYGAWKIIKSDEDNVLLRHRKGSKVLVNWQQLFMENIIFNTGEKKFLNSFFSAGGRGEVFYYENDDIFDLPYVGAYIYVHKMPAYEKLSDEGKLLVSDIRTYNDLANLQKAKIPFVLTNERSNFLGAHTGDHTNFAKSMVSQRSKLNKTGYLVFTPNTDRSIIKHELRHYNDHKFGVNKEFFKSVEHLNEIGIIDDLGEEIIKKFVLEQRAYATEIRFSSNPENFDTDLQKVLKTSSYELELNEPIYYQSRADQALDTFRAIYSQALKEYLRRLDEHKARMMALQIIPQCIESDVINCAKILDEFLD